jgi:hypothetical protein
MKSLLTFLMDIPFQRRILADIKENNTRPVRFVFDKGPSESKLFMNAHGPYVFTGRSFPFGVYYLVSFKETVNPKVENDQVPSKLSSGP